MAECGHYGQTHVKKKEERWYFKTYWLIIAFLCVGPLALPLLWLNPRFSRAKKTIVTLIIVIATYYLTAFTVSVLKAFGSYYKQISSAISA